MELDYKMEIIANDYYNQLTCCEKFKVLNVAFDLMQQYNGQSKRRCIARAVVQVYKMFTNEFVANLNNTN